MSKEKPGSGRGSASSSDGAATAAPRTRLDELLLKAKSSVADLTAEETAELIGALESRRQAELEDPGTASPFAEHKDTDPCVVQVPPTVQGIAFVIGRKRYLGRCKMARSTWQQLRGMIFADYQAEMRRLTPRGNLTGAIESLHQFRHIGVKDVA